MLKKDMQEEINRLNKVKSDLEDEIKDLSRQNYELGGFLKDSNNEKERWVERFDRSLEIIDRLTK